MTIIDVFSDYIYPELLYNLDVCPDNLKIHPELVDNIAVCPNNLKIFPKLVDNLMSDLTTPFLFH